MTFIPVFCCSRRLSVEQMVRAKRVPATASVTMTSHMCEDISFDTHMRTEMLYFHGDLHDLCKNTVVKQLENKGQEHVQGSRTTCSNWKKVLIKHL